MRILEILSLIDNLAKDNGLSKPYICGGLPRDKVMKRNLDDIDVDITTGDDTISNLALLTDKNIPVKHFLKKAQDGHYKLILQGISVDFSSNYNSPNAVQALQNKNMANIPLTREMISRDFTCNTLLMSMDLKTITDPLKVGIKDINNKIIRTCISPEVTLTEQKSRVVRAIYLAAKLKFLINKDIVEWIKNNPNDFIEPGAEYVTKKLVKAFKYDEEITSRYLTIMNLLNLVPGSPELLPYIKGKL